MYVVGFSTVQTELKTSLIVFFQRSLKNGLLNYKRKNGLKIEL